MSHPAPTPVAELKASPRNGHVPEAGAKPNSGSRRVLEAKIANTARVMFIVAVLITFCYQAATVVIPLVLALFLSMTLKHPVKWLTRLHLPVPLAAALVMLVMALVIGSGMLYMGRPAMQWLNSAPENFPQLKEKFRSVLQPAAQLSAAASKVGALNASEEASKPVQAVEVKDNRAAQIFVTWTGGLLAGVGETVGLVFLLLAFGDGFIHKLVESFPAVPDKKRAVKITQDVQHHISTYLLAVGSINLVFGTVVGLALQLLGLPNAIMWGGVAAFANFIPYFGPILGVVAVGLAGLLGFDTLGRGLLPCAAYLALHLVEANYITPAILGKRFMLNPVIIFVALIFGAWLWGVIGALLAVPILVAVKVICEHLPEFSPLGEIISARG